MTFPQKVMYLCLCFTLLLICKLLFSELSVSVANLQKPSQMQFFPDEAQPSECWGHYYLCSLRQMLYDCKTYGNISFPLRSDIYNFSSIARFDTDFFHSHKDLFDPGNPIKSMAILRSHQVNKHKDEYLTKNIHYTELRSQERKPICRFTPSGYFEYQVLSLRVDDGTPVSLSFKMSERVVTRGGAPTLMHPDIHAVVTTGRTKAACLTQDRYRGVYHIQCPLLQEMFDISVFGSYRAPSTEIYKCRTRDSWLLKSITDHDLPRFGLQLPGCLRSPSVPAALLGLPRCASHEAALGQFWLLRNDGVWHWTSCRCYFDFHFDEVLKGCLREKRILMYGDSHMQYMHQSLVDYMDLDHSIFHLKKITVASQLASRLERLAEIPMQHPHPVLVLNSGHWSLRHLDVASYVTSMQQVAMVIRALQRENAALRVFWVESTAVAYNRYNFRWKVNSVIAAMNDWVDQLMRTLPVTVIPAFDISFPVNDHTRDGAHYHQLLGTNATRQAYRVSAGGAVTTALLHAICAL